MQAAIAELITCPSVAAEFDGLPPVLRATVVREGEPGCGGAAESSCQSRAAAGRPSIYAPQNAATPRRA